MLCLFRDAFDESGWMSSTAQPRFRLAPDTASNPVLVDEDRRGRCFAGFGFGMDTANVLVYADF